MINPHWLQLLMSQINFHGPNDIRAIEVLLYAVVSIWITLSCWVNSNETPILMFL